MTKKLLFLLISISLINSFSLAGSGFFPDENKSIDSQIQRYMSMPAGTKQEALAKLKKIESTIREIHAGVTSESKSGFIGYATAKYPTPVFRYPIFFPNIEKSLGANGYTGLNLDSANQIDELVFTLPVGTVFTLLDKVSSGNYTSYQIRTREFGIPTPELGYYIDSRFVELQKQKPQERITDLPTKRQIYSNLLSAIGTIYVRGGTRYQGVDQIAEFFPSSRQSGDIQNQKKKLKGVDCSGLLFQATNGYTPRTTNQLLNFGEAVDIKGLTSDQIIKKVKGLDLIVRAGHLMIILNDKRIIESRRYKDNDGGTKIRPLKEVLDETIAGKTPANDYYGDKRVDGKKNFVIRRRYKEPIQK